MASESPAAVAPGVSGQRLLAKAGKLLSVVAQGGYRRALFTTGTVAATEHEAVLAFTAANTVIDVGANKGQFSLAARRMLPSARIIAFEVLPAALATYRKNFAGDDAVRIETVALSDRSGSAEFFVTDRQDCSSLLRPGKGQSDIYGVAAADRIVVETVRLDDHEDVSAFARPVLLKIDVQGAELMVLRGAIQALNAIEYVYVECSYTELYEGQALLSDVLDFMSEQGFRFCGALNTHFDARKGAVQSDCVFARVPA